MLMGLPVVATSSAVHGLGAVSGRDLFVQDNPSAFAHEAIHLLASPVLRAELATRGQAFARAGHSWEASTSRLAELIEAPARQHKPPQPLPIQPTPGPQLSASAKAQAVRR
jgi:glycosyltransferase involved in cell wall biosynthesis